MILVGARTHATATMIVASMMTTSNGLTIEWISPTTTAIVITTRGNSGVAQGRIAAAAMLHVIGRTNGCRSATVTVAIALRIRALYSPVTSICHAGSSARSSA